MVQKRHVLLCGFSGSGKSSIGPLLAREMNMKFVDIDALIERKQRLSISEIFTLKGERFFRNLELKTVLDQIGHTHGPAVFALGGGALQNQKIITTLLSTGVLVYLSCAVRELYRRLRDLEDRPMLAGDDSSNRDEMIERIRQLLKSRVPKYRQADVQVSTTNRTPEQVTRIIRQKLVQQYGFV